MKSWEIGDCARLRSQTLPSDFSLPSLTERRFSARDFLVNLETMIPVLAVSGTLLLVVTSLLNFSVFVRQLRAGREQLETTRRLLENARQGPEIQLVQRAMTETSDHLKVLVERLICGRTFTTTRPGSRASRRRATR